MVYSINDVDPIKDIIVIFDRKMSFNEHMHRTVNKSTTHLNMSMTL